MKTSAFFRANTVASQIFTATITVTDSEKRGRHFNYSDNTYTGIFVKDVKGNVYRACICTVNNEPTLTLDELFTSRKKNISVSNQAFVSLASLKKKMLALYGIEMARVNKAQQTSNLLSMLNGSDKVKRKLAYSLDTYTTFRHQYSAK